MNAAAADPDPADIMRGRDDSAGGRGGGVGGGGGKCHILIENKYKEYSMVKMELLRFKLRN
jgi:hypothetical protein